MVRIFFSGVLFDWWSNTSNDDVRLNSLIQNRIGLLVVLLICVGYSRWKGLTGKIVVGEVALGAVGQIHRCKILPCSKHG